MSPQCAEMREKAGVTFDQAARRLMVQRRYLRAIERGSRRLPYGLALRMAALYRCSVFAFILPHQ